MADPTLPVPISTTEQAQQLRNAGIPEEVIAQILSMGENDITGLGKQYEQSAFLRKGALSRDAKGPYGVAANILMGMGARRADDDYAKALRNYNRNAVTGRRVWFNQKYPRQVTDTPAPNNVGNDDYYQE